MPLDEIDVKRPDFEPHKMDEFGQQDVPFVPWGFLLLLFHFLCLLVIGNENKKYNWKVVLKLAKGEALCLKNELSHEKTFLFICVY